MIKTTTNNQDLKYLAPKAYKAGYAKGYRAGKKKGIVVGWVYPQDNKIK